MKSGDLFKDIFSLAVRLLGLVFLYLGLSAVTPLPGLQRHPDSQRRRHHHRAFTDSFQSARRLVAAGWPMADPPGLPGDIGISPYSPAPEEGALSTTGPAQSQRTPDMEVADKKLAALVEKPKDDRAA